MDPVVDAGREGAGPEESSIPHRGEASGRTASPAMRQNGALLGGQRPNRSLPALFCHAALGTLPERYDQSCR